jgi:N-sulfoglucosamine sulfohydrolase
LYFHFWKDEPAMPRHILFMVADDLGRDLARHGNPLRCTPHLDALADAGTEFTNAFCTTASCSASRSVMYTGLHNHQSGHYGHGHAFHHFSTFDHVESLPALFNQAGWRTGILGKVHVGPQPVYPWQVQDSSFDPRNVQEMCTRAEAFYQQAGDAPTCLIMGYVDPHRDGTLGGFGNDRNYPGVTDISIDPSDVRVPAFLPDLPETRAELVEYNRSVHRLDQGVGMMIDLLKRRGMWEDTLVVFLSDNGIPFLNAKTTIYDAGIHLPLLMHRPGQKPGLRNPNLVDWTDILPTLLDWAEIRVNAGKRRGRSVLPIIEEECELPNWSSIFASHTFHEITTLYPVRVLRNRRFKYHKNVLWKLDFPFSSDLYASKTFSGIRRSGDLRIGERSLHDYLQRPLELLYDISVDPHEIHNLADDPAYAETLTQMRAEVEAWQRATDDPWLFKDGVSELTMRGYAGQGLTLPDCHDMALPPAQG